MARYRTIKDWPEEDRPREKLLARGAEALSEAELLAILLRTGNASTGETALDHAHLLLGQFRGLKGIDEASASELRTVKGIGPAKTAQIKAGLEIGRRLRQEKWQTGSLLRSSEDVYHHFRDQLEKEKREIFYVGYAPPRTSTTIFVTSWKKRSVRFSTLYSSPIRIGKSAR